MFQLGDETETEEGCHDIAKDAYMKLIDSGVPLTKFEYDCVKETDEPPAKDEVSASVRGQAVRRGYSLR
jgi:hypothetical protein